MKDITVTRAELIPLLDYFYSFVVEDNQSCDICRFCGERYGNVRLIKGDLPHKPDCEHLIARSMDTRLLENN